MSASVQVLGSGLPPALRGLIDRHQISRSKTTADRSLARRLHDGIDAASLDVGGLAVYVHDGAVSLYGTVAEASVREDVLALASRTPGVRRIVDHLQLADG